MEPTLHDGDVVFFDPRAYRLNHPADGDIVVAQHPTQDLDIIKRVEFVDDGVYLRGDNRDETSAQDSRSFGLIPFDRVRGRVTAVVLVHTKDS